MKSGLQFPNARLFIHNLLADERVSGAEAIARCAYEYGVIDPSCLEDAELESAIRKCDCCKTAHCILRQYFKSKADQYGQDAGESAWQSVVTRLSKYKTTTTQNLANNESTSDCEQNCSNLAPVIFDLLLQEVRRNS